MRWLVRVGGSLGVLALLAVAALFLVPSETVARLASSQIEKMTGRELTLDGSVRPTVWPQLGVRTGAVTLANADWSDEGPMLTAQSLSIAIDMAALVGGTVRVTGVELVAPRLRLERAADGRVNWAFSAPVPAGDGTPAPAAATPFTIDSAVVSGGSVSYLDHATGRSTDLTDIDLTLAIPEFQGAAEVAGSARLDGQPVGLTGSVATFAPFIDGKVVPVALTATIGGSKIGFDGRLGLQPFAGEGQLDAQVPDLAAVFSVLGQAAPALPEGLGRRSITAKGALTLTAEGGVYLRKGTLVLDDNRLSGDLDFVPGTGRPRLTADMTAAALTLPALGGDAGVGGGGGATPAEDGWSTARIDASGLGAIDAAIALKAESIDLGGVTFGRTRLGLTIDAARAVVDLREVAAYGGALAGQVVVNARRGLSMRANLGLTGLALQPLLADLAGYERVVGTGDLRFNLLGSGTSMAALMKSLSGEGSLALRQGEVRGLDLAGMIRTLDAGYVGEGSKTVFDSITGTFGVAEGVLTNNDLAIAAPLLTASGAGEVDIGGRRLDYRVTPLTLGGKALDTDVQVPVLVTGPWASPKFRLDVESLARRKFDEEAKKLEERAKAELQKKLQDELGVTATEGEGIEDTAKRAAEEALQQEAERALNRLLGVED